MKKIGFILLLLLLAISFGEVWAQCPMCKIGAESNLKAGGSVGKGLNIGILMLLSLPYLVVGLIGYVWWKNKKTDEEFDAEN
ncbi:MAG: hypothetical protein KA974_08055 [Saprospiraceae bacterium]|nr:hypothetical protein [Saprospiraceae bacterium]MBP7699352.1 hypothetical protein [Saprospiraceae bacterium]